MSGRQIYQELGRRIRARRRALDLTQAAFGERMGSSRAAIANIEAGRQALTLKQIYEIASALELSRLSELVPIKVPKRETSILPPEPALSRVQVAQLENIVLSAVAAGRSARKS